MADDVPKLPHEKDIEYCVYEDTPLEITNEMTRNRIKFGAKYAYALPTQDALNTIMEYHGEKGFLEVAAGLGYWASHTWVLKSLLLISRVTREASLQKAVNIQMSFKWMH